MSNEKTFLHIVIGDDGYHLYTNGGEASYRLNGMAKIKMGIIDKPPLPDALTIIDKRRLPSAVNVSAEPLLWCVKVQWEWPKEANQSWQARVRAECCNGEETTYQSVPATYPDSAILVSGVPAGKNITLSLTLSDGNGRKSNPVEIKAQSSSNVSDYLADLSIHAGQVFINDAVISGTITYYADLKIGVNRETEESRLKELQQQVNKYVDQAIKKALRPGGTLHGHSDRNLGGFARDCAARFAGSTMLPFGGFPHPTRKIAITISGLEQWDNGIVSGATVTVDIVQKGEVIHSEVFSGKSTAEFSREVTVSASFDDIVTVHNRPDLPNLKVRAKFI